MSYIVELQPQMWIAPWGGDPGRTLKMESARVYESARGAAIALGKARRYSPFRDAKIIEVADVTHLMNDSGEAVIRK